MSRYAELPDLDAGYEYGFRDAAMSVSAILARNPLPVGSVTAFLVVMFYVSANAVWYQPHGHESPIFQTRDHTPVMTASDDGAADAEPVSRIVIERKAEPVAAPVVKPVGDPQVKRVQTILNGLNLYKGPLDGLSGPMTRDAIMAYQNVVGLPADGDITPALLEQLDGGITTHSIPVPQPAPRRERPADSPAPTGDTASKTERNTAPEHAAAPAIAYPDAALKRIQAGLRTFGHDGMEIDGLMGAKTRSAIREFQSLFGLKETGEPDAELLAKMREIGLIN